MSYTIDDLKEKAAYYGEFMLVLESDREYDFHNFTVTFSSDEAQALSEDEFRIEGMDESGEHLVVDIPVDRVEHVYAHREV